MLNMEEHTRGQESRAIKNEMLKLFAEMRRHFFNGHSSPVMGRYATRAIEILEEAERQSWNAALGASIAQASAAIRQAFDDEEGSRVKNDEPQDDEPYTEITW